MGTSVGSKALTLRQAIVVAGILEFTGAVLFGQGVSSTLATKVVKPDLFVLTPQLLLIGMFAVLLTCGLWLQIATSQGLPVASSHAVVGAIAGFSWLAIGKDAVDWLNIGRISLTWVVTPLVSAILAALLYSIVKHSILEAANPIRQLGEWIPWLSTILLSVFGVIVLPTIFERPLFANLPFPTHDLPLATGAVAAVALTVISWNSLRREGEGEQESREAGGDKQLIIASSKGFTHLLVERQLARFQVISACFVAFAHGSNDVGNAIAPLAVIAYILRTGAVPLAAFEVPFWILVIGGSGIVAGLAVWGKKVISTIGESIIPLQPSSGFCAEIATATTILLASRLGLPVSTSHALVGGVVGVGLIQSRGNLSWQTVKSIALAWLITLPAAAGLGAVIFLCLRWLFL